MARQSRGRGITERDDRVSSTTQAATSAPGPSSMTLGSSERSLTSVEGSTPAKSVATWPSWARMLATLGLVFHLLAVVAGALGVPPSSELERGIANLFTWYHDLIDQGYAYRYYAEPPPTPVILATLRFAEGKADETLRLPGRAVPGPRMRHQRQLALANALFADFQEAKRDAGDGSRSRWARAYARHLCKTNPGCRSVTLHAQQHLIPDPARVRAAQSEIQAKRFDLFDESLFTTPEWIGDYSCDGL
jgi:hypothetical protein